MKKKALKFGIFCWLILSVTAAPLLASQEGVGKVVAARGEVTAVDQDGAMRRLSIQSPVHLQDTVRTGPRGRVQIMFSDNTIFSLGRDSEMKISEYEWDPSRKMGVMKTEVKEGAFRVLGGAITKSSPEKFTTETPVATIGIRGSMYAGNFRNGALAVVFQGGTGIYVVNPQGSVDIRNPGFGTRVRGLSEAPERPERLSPEDVDKVLGELEAPAEDDGGAQGSETVGQNDSDESRAADDQSIDQDGNVQDETADQGEVTGDDSAQGITADAQYAGEEEPLHLEDSFTYPETTDPAHSGGDQPIDTARIDTTITETLTDSTQAVLSEEIDPVTDPVIDPTSPIIMSGKYTATLYDINSSTGSADAFWTGDISGESTGGLLSGEALAQDGKTFPLEITVPDYNSEGGYTGPVLLDEQTRTVNLVGSDRDYSMMDGLSSNLGDFILFSTYGAFTEGTQEYVFKEVGFAGTPSTVLPTDGMAVYNGALAGSSNSPSEGILVDPIEAPFWMGANWHSGKVMGAIFDSGSTDSTTEKSGSPVFFFGDINGTSLVNLKILGNDYDPGYIDPYPGTTDPYAGTTDPYAGTTDPYAGTTDPYAGTVERSYGYGPMFITGEGTFGQFYGSEAQGFGLSAQGETYEIYDQSTPDDSWEITGGGFRAPEMSATTARGQSRWEGFVLGIGEDMQGPNIDRRVFMNEVSGDFSLLVDRDLGTVTGSISAADLNDSGRVLNGITVGGSGNSAYLDDDTLIALITDSGAGIRNGTATGGLKTYGNYLVTENPDNRWGDYLSWGYWEAAYIDPQTGQNIHVHTPASLWVAGERTAASEVQGLIDSNFTGRYLGQAKGVYIDSFGVMQNMKDGTADLSIQFGPGANNPVTGAFNFLKPTTFNSTSGTFDYVGQTINVGAGGRVDSSGFNAGIIGGTGQVDGAFFGPGAAAVGGNFNAELGGEKYLGIFGGHLSAPR